MFLCSQIPQKPEFWSQLYTYLKSVSFLGWFGHRPSSCCIWAIPNLTGSFYLLLQALSSRCQLKSSRKAKEGCATVCYYCVGEWAEQVWACLYPSYGLGRPCDSPCRTKTTSAYTSGPVFTSLSLSSWPLWRLQDWVSEERVSDRQRIVRQKNSWNYGGTHADPCELTRKVSTP